MTIKTISMRHVVSVVVLQWMQLNKNNYYDRVCPQAQNWEEYNTGKHIISLDISINLCCIGTNENLLFLSSGF